jgi:hypothetical protein
MSDTSPGRLRHKPDVAGKTDTIGTFFWIGTATPCA